MRNGSSLFEKATARIHGVGDALHRFPPAFVQPFNSLASPQGRGPRPAATWEQMAEIAPFDINQWFFSLAVSPMLGAILAYMCPVNLTFGEYFPWWIWMAGALARERRETGVNELYLIIDDEARTRSVIVDLEDGYRIIRVLPRTDWSKLQPITEAMYFALRAGRPPTFPEHR